MVRRSWRTQLKASTRPEAVLSVVSQFLEEWNAGEIAALPAGAWPARLVTRSDLLGHAVELGRLHAHFHGEAHELVGLQELLLFFTHAAVRISQLETLIAAAAPSPLPSEQCPAGPRPKPVVDDDA